MSEIAALVQERARLAPGAIALLEGRSGEQVSFQTLAATVAGWGARFAQAGLEPGSPVALATPRPLELIGAYLGLLAAGAVVLPVDPSQPLVPEFGPWAVVTAPPDRSGPLVLSVEPDGRPPGPVGWAEPVSMMLRTSGSTGRPKGVPLQERLLLHGARMVAAHHGYTARDRVYSCLPLSHINAQVVGVLACLVSGACLVVDDRFHRNGFWEVLERSEVTVLNAVPAILAVLADGSAPPAAVVERVRFARSASAPLPLATLERFEQRCGMGVLETYGMTEAAGQICANPLARAARRPGTVGQPVGIELRVVDPAGRLAPAGVPGAVQIRGPSVAGWYVLPGTGKDTAPRRAPAVSVEGWLDTGDVGALDEDGFLSLLGRVDGVINRGGEKVYPREVEEVLRRHPGVAEVAVVAQPDPVLGERPVAFVIATDPAPADLVAQLAGWCGRALGRAKQPAQITLVPVFPTTANGKVRADLLRGLAARHAPGAEAQPIAQQTRPPGPPLGPGSAGEPYRPAPDPGEQ